MSTVKRNIWTVDPYIYKATSSGVDVFDFDSTDFIATIFHPAGVNSVWADDDYVYMATPDAGVYRATVSGFSAGPYKQYPDLLSNNVLYLHGSGDYLAIATVSGVDSYRISTDDRISTTISGIPDKCYQTAGQEHYFYVNGSDTLFVGTYYSIYNWKYVKHIELDGPIPLEGYQYTFTLSLDDVYSNSYGYDIRVIQGNGIVAPHTIQEWDPGADVVLVARLDKDVTDVYILYGFEDAFQYEGDPTEVYELYDDFDGDDINTDVWEFFSSGSSAFYYVEDSHVGIRATDNVNAGLITLQSITERARVEMRFRRYVHSLAYADIDYMYGFSGGYQTYIGGTGTGSDDPHRLLGRGLDIRGTNYLVDSWRVGELRYTETSQTSIYNGETLTASQTTPDEMHRYFFQIGNTYDLPDIWIDWVIISKLSDDEPSYTEHSAVLTLESNFFTKLYAVYNDSTSYVYSSGLNEIIQASHINDIYVTEGTSQYGNGNVLFLATDLGAVVIEERRGDEENSRFKYYRLDT